MVGRGLSRRELIVLATLAGAAAPFRLKAQEKPTRWLDAAIKAGRWIRTTRIETPDGLLWLDGPERPEGMSASPELYKPAGAGVEWDPGLDIIAGSAGTILYLLQMARELDRPASRELALKAGMRLAELGIPEAGGRKWRFANHPDAKRLMPNFSHGTSGIAYALATLHLETGRQEPLDAALAGARYLQAVAKTDGDGCLIFHHEPEPDGRDLYYLGWCHGPVGTVRLFHQLAKATKDESWMSWVKRGTRSILASGIPEKQTPGFWNNDGQCCGLAGVADFFLRLGDPEALAFARRVGEVLLSKATPAGDGLKWVHAEHRVKPDYVYAQTGYMQGAAGIGMLLLHLDAVERSREWGFRLPDSPY